MHKSELTLFIEIYENASIPIALAQMSKEIPGINEGVYINKHDIDHKETDNILIWINKSFNKLFNNEDHISKEHNKNEKIIIFSRYLSDYIKYNKNYVSENISFEYVLNDENHIRKLMVTADILDAKKYIYQIYIFDITNYFNTEVIFNEFINKHYLLLKYISDSIVLFDTNDFNIIEVSEKLYSLIDEQRSFAGVHISYLFDTDNYNLFTDFLYKKKKNIYKDDEKIKLFISSKNGTQVPVELNIFHSTFDNNNVAQLVISDLRDIFKLEEGKKLLATAIDQSAESIVITDVNGNIQYVNPCFEKISGYSEYEVLGKNPKFLQSGQTPHETYKLMWHEISHGRVWRGILENRAKKGTIYKEDVTVTPVKDHNGIITNFVAVKRDITQNLMLEEQVRQSQKIQAIGTLAGGIAHDFNNILTAIVGYTELSMALCEKDSLMHNNLNEIIKGTDRAAHLISQIMTFSRKSEKNISTIELDAIVQEVVSLMRVLVPDNVQILYKNYEKFHVKADPTQMHQVIMNLCTNACQSLEGTPGTISIKLSKTELSHKKGVEIGNLPKGSYICLQIEDNGAGIPKEYLHRIYEPFFTTKKLHQGTGLGLAVVYGIVNDHRGAIHVDSTPGKGTVFTIYLPETAAPNGVSRTLTRPAGKTHQGIILIVDDEESNVKFISQILIHLGYKVISSHSCADAQQLCKDNQYNFDLVITHQGTTEFSGSDLIQHITHFNPKIRIIFCLGYGEDISTDDYPHLDIVGFLRKPLNAHQLVQEVTKVMQMDRQ
ncbi:MAG: PAS domain S-box protein [Desulfobulbus oligotrophicus]|jgi:PAS domain S-box-containing protein|nr:PAS domain S-box protein [Desulfobulbus oligotrophicus]